jgi:gluconate 5-dehydrogenase
MGPFSLDGEVALITGGATGIGFGVARSFVECGARVVLVGRREDELRRAACELGRAAGYEVCDITQSAHLPALVDKVRREGGPVSILVNNAGVHLKKPALETTDEEMAGVVQTHVFSAFSLTRAVAPGMIERGTGSIVFIASMASLMGIPLVTAYTVAKTACVGLVRSLAAELSPCGVRVNAIAPGWIETEMLRQALDGDAGRRQKILDRTLLRRFGEPSDIGWAAVYLCSRAAKFTTGVVLPVDGGASIGF